MPAASWISGNFHARASLHLTSTADNNPLWLEESNALYFVADRFTKTVPANFLNRESQLLQLYKVLTQFTSTLHTD